MRKCSWLISALAIVGAANATTSHAQSSIGSAKSVQNKVEGIRGAKPSLLMAGSAVFQGERVRASASSQAQLVLLDDCKVDVGPNSEVTLDRFRYNAELDTGSAAVKAAPGVYRIESGKRCKPFEVKTPAATISASSEFHLLVERGYIVVSLVEGALRIVTAQGGRVILLDQPRTTVTIYVDGRVDGPSPRTDPLTKYAGNVPNFIYSWTGFYAGSVLAMAGAIRTRPIRASRCHLCLVLPSWGSATTMATFR
jgi:hypothetical protein